MDPHNDADMKPAPQVPPPTQYPAGWAAHTSHRDLPIIEPAASQATSGKDQPILKLGMQALLQQNAPQLDSRLPRNQPLALLSCKRILEEDLSGTRFKLEGWLTHCDRTAIRTIDNAGRYNNAWSASKNDQKPPVTKRSVWDIRIADGTATITCTLWDEAVASLMQQLPKDVSDNMVIISFENFRIVEQKGNAWLGKRWSTLN